MALRTTSVNLSFCLLNDFAKDKNKLAPIIYKSLTFLLIDGYTNPDLREEMLKNFISLFKQYQNIPVTILCEPLFKQIHINLDKDTSFEDGVKKAKILQPNSEYFNLNTTDFELFVAIAIHPKLSIKLAENLMDIACEVAKKNIVFTRASLRLIQILLDRYHDNEEMAARCKSIVNSQLKMILTQDISKVSMYLNIKKILNDRKHKVRIKR